MSGPDDMKNAGLGSRSEQAQEKLEAWPTQEDSTNHIGEIGETVTVFNAETGKEVLTGEVWGYTDLLGTGGIIVPDPVRGFDNVKMAIPFPQNAAKYKKEIGEKYRFRVEKK